MTCLNQWVAIRRCLCCGRTDDSVYVKFKRYYEEELYRLSKAVPDAPRAEKDDSLGTLVQLTKVSNRPSETRGAQVGEDRKVKQDVRDMASIDDVYAGGFINASNIVAQGLVGTPLTIITATEREVFKKKKIQLSFIETQATLDLNKTQADGIAAVHDRDYTKWRGKKVVLELGETEFQGQKKPTIVVKPVQ